MAAAVLCAAPSVASAGAPTLHLAPPGHAGATQYFETIPTSMGNAAPPSVSSSSNPTAGSPITTIGAGRRGVRRLARLGAAGQAAAAFAAATAPPPPHGLRGEKSSSGQGVGGASLAAAKQEAAQTASGGSEAGGLWRTLSGSNAGGIGVLLPLLLVTSLVVAILLGVARFRRRGEPPELGA
jgi:hypothetical protein